MTQNAGASLSFAKLRDALKARTEELGHSHDVDLNETLCYLTALPDGAHTPESIDALINFVSVILQCGFGECHTFGYKLLQ